MRRAIYMFVILIIFSLPAYSQEDNCIFGYEALKHIDKGRRLYKLANTENKLVAAANEFESALKYNPKCEKIYLTLAEMYIEIGQYQSRDILYVKTHSEYTYLEQRGIKYFTMAKSRLRSLLSFNNSPSMVSEVQKQLSLISTKESELNKNKRLIERREQLSDAKKEADKNLKWAKNEKSRAISELNRNRGYSGDDGFLSLGLGYGQSYGQMGIKISHYTKPNGFIFVSSFGRPVDFYFQSDKTVPLLWSAGAGFSFGTYKTNFQLTAHYCNSMGLHEYSREEAVGFVIGTNLWIFNLDLGYYLKLESDNIKTYDKNSTDVLGKSNFGVPGLVFSVGLRLKLGYY